MRFATILLLAVLVPAIALAGHPEKAKPWQQGHAWARQMLDCSVAIPLNCGTVSGTNVGAASNVANYSCTLWNESGPEVVYEFVITGPDCYDVTASISGMTADLDVFFLGSCDENDCLYYGNTTFTTGCLESGTYYIVVDGYNGAASPFTLTVDCVECTCPVPACCPFENTVYEIDFNLEDGGHWLLPCGGAPVWQWGPMTNPEVPDIACDGVPVTNILGTIIAGDYPPGGGEIAAVGPFFIDQYGTCLELCHYYDTEATYDGCNVKVSTDGGATWALLTPSRGYDQSLNTANPCIPSEQAFSGHQFNTAFLRDCFGLDDYVGMEIIVGFFWGSDSSVQYP
ncbi:MAG: hypothetical protein KAJ04_00610, partial [Candidatus Eisenbacteria sp.]|nr:hypothetical protein [Candidatus Eisenbacteria bacterium]